MSKYVKPIYLITNFDFGFNNIEFGEVFYYENTNNLDFTSKHKEKYQYFSDSYMDGDLFKYLKEYDSEPIKTISSDRNNYDNPYVYSHLTENRPKRDNTRKDDSNDNLKFKLFRKSDNLYDESEYYLILNIFYAI